MRVFVVSALFLLLAACAGTSEQSAANACRNKGYEMGSAKYDACYNDTMAMYKKGGLGGK